MLNDVAPFFAPLPSLLCLLVGKLAFHAFKITTEGNTVYDSINLICLLVVKKKYSHRFCDSRNAAHDDDNGKN